MNKTTLEVQNLKCSGCANTIITQLSREEGISSVRVDEVTSEVSFHYNAQNNLESAVKRLSRLGYPINSEANNLSKKAKSYVSCAVGKMNH